MLPLCREPRGQAVILSPKAHFSDAPISRIPRSHRTREKIFNNLAIVLAFLAGGCLTMLAVFDCVKYGQVHWPVSPAESRFLAS